MKQKIKLNENKLRQIIKESVKKVLNENDYHRAYSRGKSLDVLGDVTDFSMQDVYYCLYTLEERLKEERRKLNSPKQFEPSGKAINCLVGVINGIKDYIKQHD